MPQETLAFTPLYCIIGTYRLIHDPKLWKPMWKESKDALKRAALVASIWSVFTWPIQKLFVYYFMRGSGKVLGLSALHHSVTSKADSLDGSNDSRIIGFGLPSLTTFATMIFVIGQFHYIVEFWLRRKLKLFRNKAYEATVESRGKPKDWWTPYFEEWQDPPIEKATKNSQKQKLYIRLASPFARIFIIRVLLLPINFIPFLGLFVSAALRSLSMGRQLHTLFFAQKKMTPLQVELWITERSFEYRSFGFTAALLEQFPLFGMVFSIGNRVGAAMYSFDLEKRQQMMRQGKVQRLSREETHSNRPKIAFTQQDEGLNIPGGVFSKSFAQQNDEPPAYTVNEAKQLIGGSVGEAADLTNSSLKKRKVPPIPPSAES